MKKNIQVADPEKQTFEIIPVLEGLRDPEELKKLDALREQIRSGEDKARLEIG